MFGARRLTSESFFEKYTLTQFQLSISDTESLYSAVSSKNDFINRSEDTNDQNCLRLFVRADVYSDVYAVFLTRGEGLRQDRLRGLPCVVFLGSTRAVQIIN